MCVYRVYLEDTSAFVGCIRMSSASHPVDCRTLSSSQYRRYMCAAKNVRVCILAQYI